MIGQTRLADEEDYLIASAAHKTGGFPSAVDGSHALFRL
jgi:hypothetical protein